MAWSPPRAGGGAPGATLILTHDLGTRSGGARVRSANEGNLLLAPTLHRGRDLHRLTVFRDGAAGDVDPGGAQLLDDGVVGQYAVRGLAVDQLADTMAH